MHWRWTCTRPAATDTLNAWQQLADARGLDALAQQPPLQHSSPVQLFRSAVSQQVSQQVSDHTISSSNYAPTLSGMSHNTESH